MNHVGSATARPPSRTCTHHVADAAETARHGADVSCSKAYTKRGATTRAEARTQHSASTGGRHRIPGRGMAYAPR